MSVISASAGQRDAPSLAETGVRGRSDGKPVLTPWACLLVSEDRSLRQQLRRAADAAGWSATECERPEESMREAALKEFPLSFVDIGAGRHPPEPYDNLLRLLKRSARNLVVVCGGGGAPEDELWSRENGAWMYLPKVDEESDLARICREARSVAEKLREPAPSHARTG